TSIPAGSPDSKTVVHVVYNSRGNPESRTDAHYNHGQLVSARKSIYYYEDYDPALDASSFSPKEAAITIYPNPTKGAITLSYPDAAPGAALLVQVTNAAGQVVHAEAFTVAGPSRKIQLAA